ncbi:MAG: YkgJ family cysteine cluster protein [Paraclostridium sp.]
MEDKALELLKESIKERSGTDIELVDKNGEFSFKCEACGKCCTGRGNEHSIIMSPVDIFRLAKGLGFSTDYVLKKHTKFHMGPTSGMPMLTISNKEKFDGTSICTFLKAKDGRRLCSVQEFKPGACALYPLGRIASDDKVYYMNQLDGCNNKSKKGTATHKVTDWVPNIDETEEAFKAHNDFIMELMDIIKMPKFEECGLDGNMKGMFLSVFMTYMYSNYNTSEDFLVQFSQRAKDTIEFAKIFVSMARVQTKELDSEFKDFMKFKDAEKEMIELIDNTIFIDMSCINPLHGRQ